MMTNKLKIFVVIIVVAAAGLVTLFLIDKNNTPAQGKYDAFAQCLADKKVTMYGAYWCTHCQNQKAAFGDSFKFVSYVECTEETQKCIDAGVQGYPTWIFSDGHKLEGEQSLEKLSQDSGCSLSQ